MAQKAEILKKNERYLIFDESLEAAEGILSLHVLIPITIKRSITSCTKN